MPRTLKGKLYRTVVRPALLYGSECWALSKVQERQLHVEDAELKMREQRLRWYGHVLRRPEDYAINLVLDFEAPGKRP
ncbi:unnamed protein product [Heligmosomoides polygyrus]|uniref:Uncharacterized protein n=1 Tax=Heligmosomoides polygyrus TaxID=6339 RepID=A0A183FSR7_HELPZ|nr:unnamed protein product [Heligmosomoides polygyrus]